MHQIIKNTVYIYNMFLELSSSNDIVFLNAQQKSESMKKNITSEFFEGFQYDL